VRKNRYYEMIIYSIVGRWRSAFIQPRMWLPRIRGLRNIIVGELIVAGLEFLSVALVPFGLAFGFGAFEHRYVVFGRGRGCAAGEK
jgi:hypothetical protein